MHVKLFKREWITKIRTKNDCGQEACKDMSCVDRDQAYVFQRSTNFFFLINEEGSFFLQMIQIFWAEWWWYGDQDPQQYLKNCQPIFYKSQPLNIFKGLE